jgi:hypothetical protein
MTFGEKGAAKIEQWITARNFRGFAPESFP